MTGSKRDSSFARTWVLTTVIALAAGTLALAVLGRFFPEQFGFHLGTTVFGIVLAVVLGGTIAAKNRNGRAEDR